MIVTGLSLAKYRETLSAISQKAADEIQSYMMAHHFDVDDAFLEFAEQITVKYGEAAGALSAQFYDELKDYWARQGTRGKKIIGEQAAEIAELPTSGEIAKTVYGTLKESADQIPAAVGRLVKRTAEDTTLKNAIRDGAEWAWIPSGDTCPFCIMLASRGWQRASKSALKGGHAEHIHSNCDCVYAVRFGNDMTYADYDPSKYEDMYYDAEGGTWQAKLNSIRREQYKVNKDEINAQKRLRYAEKKGLKDVLKADILKAAEQTRDKAGPDARAVISGSISDEAYREKMRAIGENEKITNVMTQQARNTLYRRNGTPYEDLVFVDPRTGKVLVQREMDVAGSVIPTDEMKQYVLSNPREVISIHNHPHSNLPSKDDLSSAIRYKYGVVVGHDGNVIKYTVKEDADLVRADRLLNFVQERIRNHEDITQELTMLKSIGVEMEVF